MTKKNAEIQYNIEQSRLLINIAKEHLKDAEKICGKHDASYDAIENSLNLISLLEFKLDVAHDNITSS